MAIRAAARIVGAGFDQLRGAFALGGSLNDLSANTGVAVGDLVVLQREFANAEKSAEEVGPMLGKMAKSANVLKRSDPTYSRHCSSDQRRLSVHDHASPTVK